MEDNPIIKWWMAPFLPRQYIFIKEKPKDFMSGVLGYSKRWLFHPLKRRIAKYYLLVLRIFFSLKVIGVTGSAGKTTTKEMVASILKEIGPTVWSKDNIDPVYNIPATILKCRPQTRYLVLEMGIEYPGEMDFYLWLARPDISLLTNISETHTLFLNDLKGVRTEKEKIVTHPEVQIAVLNKDNSFCREIGKELVQKKVVWFGKTAEISFSNPEVSILKTKFTLNYGEDKIIVQIPIPGRQFIYNALAAAGAVYAMKIPKEKVKRGLEKIEPVPHRMNIHKLKNGALIFDDSYNNNPTAALEALHTFSELSPGKKKIIIFGDMLELGKYEEESHRKIGRKIVSMRTDILICVGRASKFTFDEAKNRIRCYFCEDVSGVMPLLLPFFTGKTSILIKGSRSVGLDSLISDMVVWKEQKYE